MMMSGLINHRSSFWSDDQFIVKSNRYKSLSRPLNLLVAHWLQIMSKRQKIMRVYPRWKIKKTNRGSRFLKRSRQIISQGFLSYISSGDPGWLLSKGHFAVSQDVWREF